MPASKKYVLIITLIVFLLGLIGYINVGMATLMWADDYCFLSVVEDGDFLQSQIETYTKTVVIAGNRYAATFFISILGYIGRSIIPIYPLITIIGLFLALTFVISRFSIQFLNRKETLSSMVMASFLTNIVLYTAPSHFQDVYWFAGNITYLTPTIVFVFLIALFLLMLKTDKKQRKMGLSILLFFLAVFAAGFSETAGVAFFVWMGFLLVFLFWVVKTEKPEIWNLSPLFGFILGILLLVLSPSGHQRSVGTNAVDMTQLENLAWVLLTSLKFGADFIRYAISGYIIPVLVVVFSFAGSGYLTQKNKQTKPLFNQKNLVLNLFFAAATYLVISASIAPSVFAFRSYPNLRSRLIGVFFLLVGLAIIGFYNGYHFPVRAKLMQSSILIGLVLVGAYVLRASWLEQAYKNEELLPRRALWTLRNEFVENEVRAGEKYITVPAIDSIGRGIETLGDFNPICFRKYYDLTHVEVVNEWPDSIPSP